MKLAYLIFIFLCIPLMGSAATVEVPGDFPTIQQAINAASGGDVVLVAANVYVENINFSGKAITVRSEDGPETTIIDGNNTDSVVKFISGEGSGSVLDGFTLRSGYHAGWGGGINCTSSSPRIINNIIRNNSAYLYGGGIYCSYAGPEIFNNIIRNNTVQQNGGGIYVNGGAPRIINNVICNNATTASTGIGGGIDMRGKCTAYITNCVIYANSAWSGGGLYRANSSHFYLTNSILWNNTATYGPQIGLAGGGTASVSYCDVMGGWGTNLNADPDFVNPGAYDFHLNVTSPCVDAGNNSAPYIPSTDMDGEDRIMDGDNNGSEIVDMGTDEIPLPTLIELKFFQAIGSKHGAVVKWETGSELDTAGFHIWRCDQKDRWIRITNSLIPAAGNPSCGAAYVFRDFNAVYNKPFLYQLEEVTFSGSSVFFRPIRIRWTPR